MSDPLRRRGFLARLASGTALFASTAGVSRAASAQQLNTRETHDLDKWIDELKGEHKQIYDCVTKARIGDMMFARNFITANVADYGLKDDDVASIVSLRHEAMLYGLNDAMWEKYKIGETLDVAQRTPRGGRGGGAGAAAAADTTRAAMDTVPVPRATQNPQMATITALASRGVHFTICSLATKNYGGQFARKTNQQAADVVAELLANVVPNCRPVSAGVIVVNRAQERGFTYLYIG